jgi:hypothetical protein
MADGLRKDGGRLSVSEAAEIATMMNERKATLCVWTILAAEAAVDLYCCSRGESVDPVFGGYLNTTEDAYHATVVKAAVQSPVWFEHYHRACAPRAARRETAIRMDDRFPTPEEQHDAFVFEKQFAEADREEMDDGGGGIGPEA